MGAWPVPWAPYGRRGGIAIPWAFMAAVGACPVPWASYGRHVSVARPLGTVWSPRGVARPLGFVWPPWGRGPSPGPRMGAVGAWPVPWALYGSRGGVARHLGRVWPP